jgi:hypothetical protein
MAVRTFIMPVIGDGLTIGTAFKPKYASLLGSYSAMNFGIENSACIVVADVTTTVFNTMNSKADAVALPINLDLPFSATTVTKAKPILEAMNIPADWVATALTYRETIRILIGMFVFLQRVSGRTRDPLFRGTKVVLSVQINQLPAPVRQAMFDAARDLGLETIQLLPTDTIRMFLKTLGQQWMQTPLTVGVLRI